MRFLEETRHKRSHGDDVAKLKWLHRYFGDLHLDEVTPDAIGQVRTALFAGKGPKGGSTDGTVNKYLALIRSILRKADREWAWLEKAPYIKLASSRPRAEPFRWLTPEKARKLLEALEDKGLHHTADMARLSLATGLRQANVTGLCWDSVDLSRQVAWVSSTASKSGYAISVPLNDEALHVLDRWRLKHPERVFVLDGKPVTKVSTRAWRNVLKSLGLRPHPGRHPENFCWHDLRHTWASWHVMAGTPLEVLQKLGGWRTIDMVLRYAHLAPGHIAAYSRNISGPNLAQIEGGKLALPETRAT
ncbi:MAG: site-specific integrase [Pseudomonadota bacterium]